MIYAQSSLNEAKSAYQQKDIATAKSKIDEAQKEPLNFSLYDFWEAKGIIYYDFYKANKASDKTYTIRKTALEAFEKGIELTKDEESKTRLKKKIKSASNACYNNAIKQAESGDIINSKIGIELFTKYAKIGNPSIDLLPLLLQYTNVKAVYYENLHKSGDKSAFEKTKEAYLEGIALSNDNYQSNFHLALLYYNRSVELIDELDFIDIDAVRIKEEESIKLHKKALPYALVAYSNQPHNKVVLEMLEGIYFNIRNFEKADEFKLLLEKL